MSINFNSIGVLWKKWHRAMSGIPEGFNIQCGKTGEIDDFRIAHAGSNHFLCDICHAFCTSFCPTLSPTFVSCCVKHIVLNHKGQDIFSFLKKLTPDVDIVQRDLRDLHDEILPSRR